MDMLMLHFVENDLVIWT